ncbi:hypothetical protein ABW20_dc0109168 [Dactylellina cionopaga]|nr:hypothetical protein ABW20_dc0109168 [Dactylellina cionopaga]
MSPGSPARPAAAASSRPVTNRLVFRPYNHSDATVPANATPRNTIPRQQSQNSSQNKSAQTSSSQTDEYGIDFEVDDEDAQAIELVFAEYTQKLNQKEAKEKTRTQEEREQQRSFTLLPSSSSQQKEEGQVEQEDYHDSFALDSLLDLEYDDAELLAALVSQELPSSQSYHQERNSQLQEQNQQRQADKYWRESQDDWNDDDIDRQILWEHDQWLQRTDHVDSANKDKNIIDDTPETKEKQQAEADVEKAYQQILEAGEPTVLEPAKDSRSPLDRFRNRGGNVKLSVSDLLSNMWCEQQFHYSLLRGFKRRTAEMQAGTKIHREMEEQVHTVVPVTVKTKHDKWGVRIWNMVQGLESLKTTGLTRELEVWGWIDGVFINGVIDEVNFKKFQHEGEEGEKDVLMANEFGKNEQENRKPQKVSDKTEELEISSASNITEVIITAALTEVTSPKVPETPKKKRGRPKKQSTASPEPTTPKMQQTKILDFITPSPNKSRTKGKPAYVLDLKTRSSPKIPEAGSSQSVSVHLQLMLYRQLLNDMIKATPKSMIKKLCSHHDIPADEPFSDDLIAGMAGTGNQTEAGQDELTLLLENNSIEKLYTLYYKKLKQTISTIAPELAVVYRWQRTGEFLDSAEYLADDKMLKEHVDSVITWWKGQRETVGVEIEEAWKCRKCEFMEDCTWRLAKVEEVMDNMRSKRRNNMV